MYEAREQTDILTELQNHSKVEASKIEGTFEYDVFSSNSIEFGKTEIELERMYKAAFADSSGGEYLTKRAAESGIIRKDAVNAIGVLKVSGNGTLPAGSVFSTEDGSLSFETTEAAEVRTSAQVNARAIVAGEAGNVAAGTITKLPMSIPGINGVTNEEAFHDGYDEETDENLLDRYLVHVRTPGTSGNKYHYLEWALAVPGVGGARVIPTWAGPTTVKVIIVDSNYNPASEDLISRVFNYIEEVRPTGAVLTVVSAVPKQVNISATVSGTVNQENFENAVKNYFIDLEKKNIKSTENLQVSVAKIGSLLLNNDGGGAEDYTDLLLNNDTINIPLTAEEIAVLGTVTLT